MTTTHEERMAFADTVFARCKEIMDTKGRSYGGDVDATSNFKQIAEQTGQSKYHVLMVYMTKHMIAVNKAINRNPDCPQMVDGEPMSERVADIINYLVLLLLMQREDEAAAPPEATNELNIDGGWAIRNNPIMPLRENSAHYPSA